jgi:peptidoglycan/LPS O-acetylase OafA/YrhL
MSLLKYRPDIDGLRAIAVLGVVFYHADLGFPGGYVGVDVFFVISGYLITSLILKELKSGHFSMLNFWERRARRILPALAVLVAVVLALGWFVMLPADYETLGKQTIALVFFSSNIKFWMESGYFDSLASEKPLLHTWSLSLEEQFYLVIPILLGLLFKLRRSGWVVPVLGGICLVSFSLSIFWVEHQREAAFYLLPARAWELGVGSLVAFCVPVSRVWVRNGMAWLGLLGILCPFFFYSSQTPFPGLAALPPVAGAALLIWSGMAFEKNSSAPFLTRVLAVRPFVWIGLISYSLYLWHWPLFAFTKYFWNSTPSPPINSLLVAASFFLAWLSYRFVEQPFRTRKTIRSRARVFWLSGAAVSVLLLVAFGLWAGKGFPKRLPEDAVKFAKGKNDWSTQFGGDTRLEDIPDRLARFGAEGGEVEVFVWGDSHAMAILPVVDEVCKELNLGAVAAKSSSTAPVLGWASKALRQGDETFAYNQAVMNGIKQMAGEGKLKTVILAARWSGYSNGRNLAFNEALQNTIAELSRTGCRVVYLQEVPNFPFEPPKALALAKVRGENLTAYSITLQNYEKGFAPHCKVADLLARENANVEVISPGIIFANAEGAIFPFDKSGVLYRDSHHLSTHGSMKLKEQFLKLLSKKSERSGINY